MGIAFYFGFLAAGLIAAVVLTKLLKGIKLI